jgi:hypothetical protein
LHKDSKLNGKLKTESGKLFTGYKLMTIGFRNNSIVIAKERSDCGNLPLSVIQRPSGALVIPCHFRKIFLLNQK